MQVRKTLMDTSLHVGAQPGIQILQLLSQSLRHLIGIFCDRINRLHGKHGLCLAAKHRDAHIHILALAECIFNCGGRLLDQAEVSLLMQTAGSIQHKLHRHLVLVRRRRNDQVHGRFLAIVQTFSKLGQPKIVKADLLRMRIVAGFSRIRRQCGRHHAKQHDGSQNPR